MDPPEPRRRFVRRPKNTVVQPVAIKEEPPEEENVVEEDIVDMQGFLAHSEPFLTPEQQERQLSLEDSIKFMEKMNRMDIAQPRMVYPARAMINCPPFTSSSVVEQYELFLTCLCHRFTEKYGSTVAPPSPPELFNMQDELLDPVHFCFNSDNACDFWTLGIGTSYYSVLLDQQMVAIGTVSICMTTGSKHICDGSCMVQNEDQIYACMVTGIEAEPELRYSAPMSRREGERPETQFHYSGPRKRKAAHPIYDQMDLEKKQSRFSEPNTVFVADQQPAPGLSMAGLIKQEATGRFGIETDSKPSASWFKTVRAPQKRTKVKVFYTAREAVESEEMRYQTRTVISHAVKSRVMKTSYKNIRTAEDECRLAQDKVLIKYLRWCLRLKIQPNRGYAQNLFEDTRLQIQSQTDPETLDRTSRFYIESLMYYWTILAPYVFEEETNVATAWESRALKFVNCFLELMRTGLSVEGGRRPVLARDVFLEKNLERTTRANSSRPMASTYGLCNTIKKKIAKHAEEEGFLESLCFDTVYEVIRHRL